MSRDNHSIFLKTCFKLSGYFSASFPFMLLRYAFSSVCSGPENHIHYSKALCFGCKIIISSVHFPVAVTRWTPKVHDLLHANKPDSVISINQKANKSGIYIRDRAGFHVQTTILRMYWWFNLPPFPLILQLQAIFIVTSPSLLGVLKYHMTQMKHRDKGIEECIGSI